MSNPLSPSLARLAFSGRGYIATSCENWRRARGFCHRRYGVIKVEIIRQVAGRVCRASKVSLLRCQERNGSRNNRNLHGRERKGFAHGMHLSRIT